MNVFHPYLAGDVGYIEISDAAPQPIGPLIEDTVYHRKLCGEGEL